MDRSTSDTAGEAADWQAYGVFLKQHDFPKPLAYACLVRADSLASDSKTTLLPESQQARTDLEVELGKEAAGIRKETAPLLDQALLLQAR